MARACFFDMDGTVIDSRADLAATVNHTRRDLGLDERPEDEILSFVGHGAKRLLADAIPEAKDDSLLERFLSHYAEHMLEHVTLYPGVRRTLETLRARGWLLGVNTAKPAFAVKAILDKFGLAELFGAGVVAGGDCPEMKPSALPLRQCADRLGHVLSADDWMVGDNWTDIACAQNAGVKSTFCAFGFGKVLSTEPTVTIARFDALLDIL